MTQRALVWCSPADLPKGGRERLAIVNYWASEDHYKHSDNLSYMKIGMEQFTQAVLDWDAAGRPTGVVRFGHTGFCVDNETVRITETANMSSCLKVGAQAFFEAMQPLLEEKIRWNERLKLPESVNIEQSNAAIKLSKI